MSVDPSGSEKLEDELKKHKVGFTCIGSVITADVIVDNKKFGQVSEYADIYDNTLEVLINRS